MPPVKRLKLAFEHLISVDPGTEHCGVALWRTIDRTLIRAGLIETRDQNVALMRNNVLKALIGWGLPNVAGQPRDFAIIELPQVYGPTTSKADPADLIFLATVTGAVASLFLNYEYIVPRAWKGQMPKDVVQARLHRAPEAGGLPVDAFMRMEPCAKGKRHNVYDALGIGWWKLNRR